MNMDVPRDSETYLHRIGRAGRFGEHHCGHFLIVLVRKRFLFFRLFSAEERASSPYMKIDFQSLMWEL